MPYLGVVTDWFDDWDFRENDIAEDVFEDMQAEWQPNNRFTIQKLLGNDVPDFVLWIQDQIDDDTEDTTETITFPPERIERDEKKESEILDTEIELLEARKELLELQIRELEEPREGIIEGVKRFIRNIFRG